MVFPAYWALEEEYTQFLHPGEKRRQGKKIKESNVVSEQDTVSQKSSVSYHVFQLRRYDNNGNFKRLKIDPELKKLELAKNHYKEEHKHLI